ncbi:DUF4384 domain-containing protein [Lepagella muris]|jgi:hypothetical protein|uniref:DUF4384 domain-containing protein n=1 Tax=Lepagella muris TaxID=3032870 RepID=A0AC61RBW4_9BACT|nr:DUF4384 domain-containing protein [Lepagella muris]ROT05238.1 DUF4384 domain-containing protein [Muribaculaceae bacterium Isolate-037 (Harlan)]TGY77748.1 DUF4384 domain-containing protein [Lepagella muris]THG50698.1 DUF4384 domain-containing protein [Bacteroidales bacterium]TKC56094.1 DUF4384 domain-containing protein [Bacteroidales bacterium]
MKGLKIIVTAVVAIFMATTAVAASPVKTVKGEYTYYGDKATSPAECKRLALEGARLDALAKEYGTIVTQDVLQADRIDSKGEANKFLSLSSTEVKGEWIADDGEPEFEITLDKDDNLVVRCKVKGKAREISNESTEFDARVLRNGTKPGNASTDFYDGDDLYLYFTAPVDGYVSVFLSLEDGNVYQMLPYLSDTKGEAKVKRNYDYVFFDPTKAEGTFGTPDQFRIATAGVIEFNKIYVVFSPSYFAKPVMRARNSMEELPSMSEDDFSKWLVKSRRNDSKMGVRQMNLKIYPK